MEQNEFKKSLKDIQKINRIITALSSTKDLEDIYSIILCALISPEGLNFSRSFLFTYNKKPDNFTGNMMLGPSSEEEALSFYSEMEKEEKALEEILQSHSIKYDLSQGEIWDFCLSGLKVSGLWISMVQKLGSEHPYTNAIRKLSFSPYGRRKGENFFHEVCKEEKPQLFNRKEKPDLFPPRMMGILDDRFIAIPICSKTSPYAVVLVDKRFSPKPISRENLCPLQWFLSQAKLAVENSILYHDLQVAYDELKEMDILKSNFLSTVSHELRTPLTMIHGFVELLLDNRVDEISGDQRQLLNRVARNTRHIINMINDIIDVAEIQTHGMADFMVEPTNPELVLSLAIDRVKERRGKKNVQFDILSNQDIPAILAEKKSLERILYQILDNAVKFSQEGGKITVCFKQVAGEFQFIINDEGIGIEKDKLQKIFEVFYQVDSKLSRSFEGLGLGLTITRLLLSATGGKILVQSSPGKGSTFTIIYPIAKS